MKICLSINLYILLTVNDSVIQYKACVAVEKSLTSIFVRKGSPPQPTIINDRLQAAHSCPHQYYKMEFC